jgi:palmitoyltransferase ZDHHC3/7/25
MKKGPRLPPFSQRDTSHYSDNSDNDDKRRSTRAVVNTRRLVSYCHHQLQALSYRIVPPYEDETTYEDVYCNDYDYNYSSSWQCTVGTLPEHGIWRTTDPVGTVMAASVWILVCYSAWTVVTLAVHNHHIPTAACCVYCTLAGMALASHAKTSLTDPGAVPPSAVPLDDEYCYSSSKQLKQLQYSCCSHCQTYKPVGAHHCRICNRCVAGMDHHCPWMNNCIGAANMKHFVLFLMYTWTSAIFALLLFVVHYFFCNNSGTTALLNSNTTTNSCEFTRVQVQLVRFMSALCLATLAFTSSMLMNVLYGIMTGIGTIDRLKKQMSNSDTVEDSTEEAKELKDIFGVEPLWTWFFPIDPVFEDYDAVMGYTTRQRLLRQEQFLVQANEEIQGRALFQGGYDDISASAFDV